MSSFEILLSIIISLLLASSYTLAIALDTLPVYLAKASIAFNSKSSEAIRLVIFTMNLCLKFTTLLLLRLILNSVL